MASLARGLPSNGPRSMPARVASTMTCWPDRARMWAHPASRKAAASQGSSSSRTPTTRASRRGPASPPAARSASSRLSLAAERHRSTRGAASMTARPPGSAKQAGQPVVPSGDGRTAAPLTDSLVPRGCLAPPRVNTARRPAAPERAPSGPRRHSSSSSWTVSPETLRRGSETTLPSAPVAAKADPGAKPPPAPPASASARHRAPIPSASPRVSARAGSRASRPTGAGRARARREASRRTATATRAGHEHDGR